jgi:hypothetical protein
MVLSERSESKGFMIDGRYGNQMPVYYVYILRTLDNTLYILKLLPFWDPLRRDPRFEKIVASLAPKE